MNTNDYVLLVEDNPDEILLTQRAFKKGNIPIQLKIVTNGKQALDFFVSRSDCTQMDTNDKLKLILLDLNLPLISGLDVLKEVRANPATSRIPIIVLTSSTEEKDQIESYRLGANDYVRKPTGFAEFTETVKNIVIKWVDHN